MAKIEIVLDKEEVEEKVEVMDYMRELSKEQKLLLLGFLQGISLSI